MNGVYETLFLYSCETRPAFRLLNSEPFKTLAWFSCQSLFPPIIQNYGLYKRNLNPVFLHYFVSIIRTLCFGKLFDVRGRVFIFKTIIMRKSQSARGNDCEVSKNVSSPTLNPRGNVHRPLPCSKPVQGSPRPAGPGSGAGVPGAASLAGTRLSGLLRMNFLHQPNWICTLCPNTLWAFLLPQCGAPWPTHPLAPPPLPPGPAEGPSLPRSLT